MNRVELSIVVPVFNESGNVRRLFQQLEPVLATLECRYEVIFVDDGSHDDTWNVLRELYRDNEQVCAIRFARNFGQTAAMRAGIEHARGSRIVTMDGDLQNDPRDIPRLLEKMDEGFDLVVGWRRDRRDSLWLRTMPSRVANLLIGWITGLPVHDNGCSLKAYRSQMIKQVPLYSEMHRFIPALSQLAGARVTEVVVRHHARRHGESKYGLTRVGRVLLDVFAIKMLVSFAQRPLQWFGALSIPFFLAAFMTLMGCGITWAMSSVHVPLVVTSLAFLLLLYIAVHLLFVGLLGELVIKSSCSRVKDTGNKSPRN